MKMWPIAKYLIIGAVVGTLVPYSLSFCLFGTQLQTFLAHPQPETGFWSGAPTPMPTAVPSPIQVWTTTTLTSSGGAFFVLWSVLGAFAGEAIAARRGDVWNATRQAWLGAIAGSIILNGLALCAVLR
jgi:hypothetical protein